MSLSKVTSDNGSSLARFTADHAAVPFLGAPLPNSPDGSKDYVWAAVHILGVAIVAGSKSFACGPQLGKSDMHAAVLNKILLHWVENTQIRGQANQPLEHAHAVTAFLESADEEAKALAKLPFKYVPANNEPVTAIHSQPYVEGELLGDNDKLQGALFEVTNSRTGQTTALDLVKFVEKAGKSGIDFLNMIGPCSTPAERTDKVLKATVGVLLLTSLQTYLNRGGELDLELTDLVGKASQKERVLDFLDRTRDLPEGTEHVRMSEGEHVVLHVALRAAAIKMSEEFDQAALGTFDFSKFPSIDRLLLAPRTPRERDGALASLRVLANELDAKAPFLSPSVMHQLDEFVKSGPGVGAARRRSLIPNHQGVVSVARRRVRGSVCPDEPVDLRRASRERPQGSVRGSGATSGQPATQFQRGAPPARSRRGLAWAIPAPRNGASGVHHAEAWTRSAPKARPNFVNPPTFPRARASANHWDSPRSSRFSSLSASLYLTRLSLQWESRPPARSRLVVDVKTRKRIRENPNGPRTEFEARTGRHLSARPKSWAGLG